MISSHKTLIGEKKYEGLMLVNSLNASDSINSKQTGY